MDSPLLHESPMGSFWSLFQTNLAAQFTKLDLRPAAVANSDMLVQTE